MTTYAGRAVFPASFVDPTGDPQEDIGVTIYNRGTTVVPTRYTDRTKATTTSTAVTTDVLGNLNIFLDPGDYDAVINGVTLPFTVLPDHAEPAIPGTYVATSLATLQAHITAAQAAGGGDILIASSIALGTTGVTVPNGVNIVCVNKGELTYTGFGAAITFDAQLHGHSVLRVRRVTRQWGDGTDTSSIGIRLRNCAWTTYDIGELFSFETGLELRGEAVAVDAGTAYCHINVGRITNNKRNIRFTGVTTGAGTGFANGNSFQGGAVRHDGGLSGSYVGTIGIDMSADGDGNTFTGVNLEGGAVEKTVVITASHNVFVGCRLEEAQVFHFLSTAIGNMVIGGYGNFGPDVAPFVDDSVSKQNCVWGSRGVSFVSDGGALGSPAGVTVRAIFSGADKLYRTVNVNGDETWNMDGSGRNRQFVPGEAYERLMLDQYAGASGYGAYKAGRGNVAPDTEFGRGAGNPASWIANCGIGNFGVEPPGTKPAAPTDVATIVALLRSYGMCI